MIRVGPVTLLTSALLLSSCSKTLTQSRAVNLSQSYADTQNGGTVSTSIDALLSQLGPEMPQPFQAVGVQRLVKDGYIHEAKVMVAYPNFTGQFTGSHVVTTKHKVEGRGSDPKEAERVASEKWDKRK
jgi:hypothetical protein